MRCDHGRSGTAPAPGGDAHVPIQECPAFGGLSRSMSARKIQTLAAAGVIGAGPLYGGRRMLCGVAPENPRAQRATILNRRRGTAS